MKTEKKLDNISLFFKCTLVFWLIAYAVYFLVIAEPFQSALCWTIAWYSMFTVLAE